MRWVTTDGAAVKLAHTLLNCLRRHLLALAARDDVGVRREVCIRVPEPRADYFQWHSILQLQRRVRVQQSIWLEQRLEPGLLLSPNLEGPQLRTVPHAGMAPAGARPLQRKPVP